MSPFTNGVEARLDMPGLPVKPGLLRKCNSSSVVTEESHWSSPRNRNHSDSTANTSTLQEHTEPPATMKHGFGEWV